MEKHHSGLGEYKFQITLPDIIHADKRTIYPKLAPVANA
jgi:hypothetical protein